MDKLEREEILIRAKATTGPDEREREETRNSFRYAYIAGAIMAIIVMIVNIINGQPWADVYAVLLVMYFVHVFWVWNKAGRTKRQLRSVTIVGLAALISIAAYVIETIKL